jgi:cathepsin D
MSEGLVYKKLAANGILGLAFEGISVLMAKPVFQTLVDENRLDDSVFGLSLAGSDPVLTVGGRDRSRYKGKLTCVPIHTSAVRISRDVSCLHFNGHDTGSLADQV